MDTEAARTLEDALDAFEQASPSVQDVVMQMLAIIRDSDTPASRDAAKDTVREALFPEEPVEWDDDDYGDEGDGPGWRF